MNIQLCDVSVGKVPLFQAVNGQSVTRNNAASLVLEVSVNQVYSKYV